MTQRILDTDHISLYQRGDRLVIDRVTYTFPKPVVTIISLEEQLYGI